MTSVYYICVQKKAGNSNQDLIHAATLLFRDVMKYEDVYFLNKFKRSSKCVLPELFYTNAIQVLYILYKAVNPEIQELEIEC